jgi:hypothetical protein
MYGITPVPATFATGTVTATGTNGDRRSRSARSCASTRHAYA